MHRPHLSGPLSKRTCVPTLTPDGGIQDTHVSAGPTLGAVNLGLVYHLLKADYGDQEFGNEIGLVADTKIGLVGITLKYADYQAKRNTVDGPAFARDTSKLWLMAAATF